MKFALHPGIQGTMDGKVQLLETSDFIKPDDNRLTFCLAPKSLQCTEVVVEKNVRHQVCTGG